MTTATENQSTPEPTTPKSGPKMVMRYEVDAFVSLILLPNDESPLPEGLHQEVRDAFESRGIVIVVQTPEATVNVHCATFSIRPEDIEALKAAPAAPSTPAA